MGRAVVIIAGGSLDDDAVASVADDDLLIAADSGLDVAIEAGLSPTVLVGDLDSISAGGTMWAYAHDVTIARYPADKDATDTSLSIEHALSVGCDRLLVLGGTGDRLDHTLGTLTALGAPALQPFRSVSARLGSARVHVVRPPSPVQLEARPGTTFSLLALHGRCSGVDVSGARWPLSNATLEPGSTLGISNETDELTTVGLADGVLTVVIP